MAIINSNHVGKLVVPSPRKVTYIFYINNTAFFEGIGKPPNLIHRFFQRIVLGIKYELKKD